MGEKGGCRMSGWRRLDLISRNGKPTPERLVAIRKVPVSGRATFYNSEQYDIGCFKQESRVPGSRKLWWHGTRGPQDPARMKKHYDIWWCPVQEFDGL